VIRVQPSRVKSERAIRFAAVAARDYLGPGAVYAVAVASGFVDVDAVTLSTARQAAAGGIDPPTAWRVILVAYLTNLLFKTGIAGLLGSARLLEKLFWPVGVTLAAGAGLFLFWPDG
jgi:uncharacterized membrane protein (DUF4010 family)